MSVYEVLPMCVSIALASSRSCPDDHHASSEPLPTETL